MPVQVRCPNNACRRELSAPDAAAGRSGRCPSCGARVAIPARAGGAGESGEFVGFEPADKVEGRSPGARTPQVSGRRLWPVVLTAGGAGGGFLVLALVVVALLSGLGIGRTRRPLDRPLADRADGASRPLPLVPAAAEPAAADPSAADRYRAPATLDEALAGLDLMAGPPARIGALEWLAKARPDDPRRVQVVAAIESQLHGGSAPGVRELAVGALAVWAGPDEVPVLAGLLVDPSPEVRHEAIDALARLRDLRGAEPLARRLAEPRDREAAGRALTHLGTPARPVVAALLGSDDAAVRDAARAVLDRTGGVDPAAEVEASLADLAGTDPDLRRLALARLGRLPPEAGDDSRLKARVAATLEPLARSPDRRVRATAIHALSTWATLASVPTLVGTLVSDEPDIRRQAIETLGRLEVEDPKVVAAIASRMNNPEDLPHASMALRAIGAGAEEEVIKLLRSPEPQIRLEACHVLRVIGTRKCLPALRKLAADLDHDVARAAVTARGVITQTGTATKTKTGSRSGSRR